MIIINTTFNLDKSLQEEFLVYIRQKFIPMSTKSGILTSARLARVFGREEDEDLSYAIEFQAADIEQLEKWNKEESKEVYNTLMETFKEKLVGFSTVMQIIEL